MEFRSLHQVEAVIKQRILSARGDPGGRSASEACRLAGVIDVGGSRLTNQIPVWNRHADGAATHAIDDPTARASGR